LASTLFPYTTLFRSRCRRRRIAVRRYAPPAFHEENRMKEWAIKTWGLVPHLGFLWPMFLWLLIVVPLAVLLYVLIMRRRKKSALDRKSTRLNSSHSQ